MAERGLRSLLPLIGTLLIIILIVLYIDFYQDKVNEDGIISIGKVVEYSSRKSGASYRVKLYYKDKVSDVFVSDAYCDRSCIGNFFFIKFLESSPSKYPTLYKDKPVPECILMNVKYYEGWDYFPDCTNYRNTKDMIDR